MLNCNSYMGDKNNKKLDLKESISLVVGNMIGAGIFMLPASLAKFGSISIFGWVISGFGAILIALIFKRLSQKFPGKSGPFHYTKEGFGEFLGFFVVWGYWISILLTNAGLAIAITSYSGVLFPVLQNNVQSIMFSIVIIIVIAIINNYGIKTAGKFQLVTSILKILPLLLTIVIAFFVFNTDHFITLNTSGESNFNALTATAALTFFAFMGIESATIPAEGTQNPSKTIPKATMIGSILTICIYLFSSIALMGIISPIELANSTAPFADATGIVLGNIGKNIVAIFAIIAAIGALNGWTLLQAEIPKSLAQEGLLGSSFKELNKKNVPSKGLFITSSLVCALILLNYSKGLVDIFTFLILTGTFCALILYLFTSLSEILILIKQKKPMINFIQPLLLALPAFGFTLWMIIGTGGESIFYGILLLSISIPIYIYYKKFA
mgnify:FL=1